jgi:hypothetical protein
MRLDDVPRPAAKRPRLAPKTTTWNEMIVFRRFREYDIAKMPRKIRTAAVVVNTTWSVNRFYSSFESRLTTAVIAPAKTMTKIKRSQGR